MKENQILKIEGIKYSFDADGGILLNLKDVAVGLGFSFTQTQGGKEYIKIRWGNVVKLLEQFGFVQDDAQSSLSDTYISEPMFYLLAMKANSEEAKAFQIKAATEIFPSIRKIATSLESITYRGNVDGIVFAKDGVSTTTSRIIASVFNKQHKHVLDIIDDKIKSNNSTIADFSAMNIKQVEYLSENGRLYREYELTEAGFSFIALGLNGEKADEYKIKYINAFQKMQYAIFNMLKAKALEEVLPQDSKLRQYVYVIKNPYSELIKIGVARDVNQRLNQLKTGAGVDLELVYKSMICSNAFKIEKLAHDRFSSNRTFGEWFNINATEAVAFIEQQEFTMSSNFNNKIGLLAIEKNDHNFDNRSNGQNNRRSKCCKCK